MKESDAIGWLHLADGQTCNRARQARHTMCPHLSTPSPSPLQQLQLEAAAAAGVDDGGVVTTEGGGGTAIARRKFGVCTPTET